MNGTVLTGPERRRRFSASEKAGIIAETLMPGATVTAVAKRHGIARGLLYTWRRLSGNEGAGARELGFVPVAIAGENPAATARVPGRIEIADRHGLRVVVDATVPERTLRLLIAVLRQPA